MSSLRILVLDDHEDTLRALKILLQRRGHDVTCVSTAKEAIEVGQTQKFDIAILDLMLPDGNGYDVMEEIRIAQNIPFIALTALGMKKDISKALAAGFCVHLLKPCGIEDIDKAIAKCLQPQARNSSA